MKTDLLTLVLLIVTLSAAPLSAETWRFTARQVSSTQASGRSATVLDGEARVESEKMIIEADHLELDGEGYSRISGSGGVSLTDNDKGVTVESERFEYDRDAKIIRFREQVTLVDEEQGIVIRCESLDLQEEEDLVIMQVAVRLIKGDIVCRGEFATYLREENHLEISGRPVVWRKDDEYRANRITVDLNTDEILMEGTVSGALTTEESPE